MKIFISWSGERSQKIAELFKDWIQCVIQAAKPWISSHDVDRGALWYTEISKTLADSQFGILCLTPENKTEPVTAVTKKQLKRSAKPLQREH